MKTKTDLLEWYDLPKDLQKHHKISTKLAANNPNENEPSFLPAQYTEA